ncbi:MAG: hypothetical protein M1835_006672 [Candelina submexicana]|nr:MAG: hypothetical protein M1835_006672 [Candelina submexicana]
MEVHRKPLVMQIPRNPSNAMTTLVSAMVSKVDPTIDIRYQLVWNFGGYLVDVPRHLGVNPALDTASDALVSAHTSYCSSGPAHPGHELWAKYSHALNALREALNDPSTAQSAETLCAIMLLMITQVLTNPTQGVTASHPKGAALVLKSRGSFGPRNDFEKTLLATLRGPVVLEALISDNIQFTQQEWKSLIGDGLDARNVDAGWFIYLACLPDLMRRCRRALRYSSTNAGTGLPELVSETVLLLEKCRTNIAALRHRLSVFEDNASPSEMTSRLHAHRVRMLSMALFTGIILSCVLTSSSGEPLRLRSESSQWSHEILELAKVAAKYLPLGTMAIVLCLYAAWISAASDDLRKEIEGWIIHYEKACLGSPAAADLTANLEKLERRFTFRDPWQDGGAFNTW